MFWGYRAASRMSLSHTQANVWRISALLVQWSHSSPRSLPKGTFLASFLELSASFLEVLFDVFLDLFFVVF